MNTPNDPLLAEATEIVRELIRQGLTRTEMCRLCGLLGRTATIGALHEGTAKSVKPEVLEALKIGYQRFDAGETFYRVRRSTRPAEVGVQKPDATPQPRLLNEDSALVKRLREKRREMTTTGGLNVTINPPTESTMKSIHTIPGEELCEAWDAAATESHTLTDTVATGDIVVSYNAMQRLQKAVESVTGCRPGILASYRGPRPARPVTDCPNCHGRPETVCLDCGAGVMHKIAPTPPPAEPQRTVKYMSREETVDTRLAALEKQAENANRLYGLLKGRLDGVEEDQTELEQHVQAMDVDLSVLNHLHPNTPDQSDTVHDAKWEAVHAAYQHAGLGPYDEFKAAVAEAVKQGLVPVIDPADPEQVRVVVDVWKQGYDISRASAEEMARIAIRTLASHLAAREAGTE